MDRLSLKSTNKKLRKTRVRSVVRGTEQRPRLSVYISNRHVSAQIINDQTGKTLAASTTVNVVLPRVRDFHGVSNKAFDPQGNFSLGLMEQSVFPELTFEDISQLHGLQINFVIKGSDPERSKALLEKFGIPFEKEERK